jgi:hypothetical protein
VKPSTEAILIALAVAACSRAGSVVDAAMIPTELAAAQTKPDAGRPPPLAKPASGELPWRRGQKLRGFYYCTQGKTTLTVTVDEVSGDDVDATAEFTFPGSGSRFPPARGSWRMRGSFDAGKRTVRLEADAWIDQPDDYTLVDFAGKVDPEGGIRGTVDGEGCSSFMLTVDKTTERR